MKKVCPICQKEYFAKPSANKYCSRDCARIAVKKDHSSVCQYCGKTYEYERRTQKYCSAECRQKASRKPKKVNICKTCGKEFIPKYPEQIYCSHTCHGETRRNGCSNPNLKRLYSVWQNMKKRCYDKRNSGFKNYGGRGITVCQEWKNNFDVFAKWALSTGYDKDAKRGECTLDRIDVDKGYYPENCRWVNIDIQANNKRTNVNITMNGETKTFTQWCKFYGKDEETIRDRVKHQGMTFEEAITTPVKPKYIYITYCGETRSISAWERFFGFSDGFINSRINKGWSIEDAFEVPRKFERMYVTIMDKTLTIKEMAKYLRVNSLELYKDLVESGRIKKDERYPWSLLSIIS